MPPHTQAGSFEEARNQEDLGEAPGVNVGEASAGYGYGGANKGYGGAKTAPAPPTRCSTCTAACKRAKNPVCDLPYSAGSYDKKPKGDTKFSCNINCGGWWGKWWVAKSCKTQTTVGNKRSWTTCDSCKEGYALEVKFAKSRAGYCKPYTKEGRVACARLDSDDPTNLRDDVSAPPGDNILCTK